MVDFFYRGENKSTALDRLQQASLIAYDTESVSLNDLTCIGIGVYWSDTEGAYFPVFPEASEHLLWLTAILGDKTRTKIGHNIIGFDLEVQDRLAEEGFSKPDDTNIEDTSIMAQVRGLPPALQRLGNEFLGATDLFSIADLFAEHGCKDMLGVPPERTAEKCLNDCRTTWQLYQALSGGITGSGQERIHPLSAAQRDCYEVDRQLIHVLRNMQKKGLGLRQGVLEEHKARLERSIDRLECDLAAEGIDQPGSTAKVGYVLACRGNMLPRTQKGRGKQLSTAEEVLEELDDPLAKTILEWRKETKLLSTYVLPWLGADRAYTHFRLDLATGRLASGSINTWDHSNRNLQNIPPNMREVFKPDNGIWTWADHSQLELRIISHMSQDPMLKYDFDNGGDLHQVTANIGGITRTQGKTFNFANNFGAAEAKLAKSTGLSLPLVRSLRAGLNERYKVSVAWKAELQDNCGEYAETLFGRRCRLPDRETNPLWMMWSDRKWQAHLGACNVNYRIQGTGADILKRGILLLDKYGLDQRLSIHDEALVDGDVEFPDMEYIHPELSTPVEVKRGLVWS